MSSNKNIHSIVNEICSPNAVCVIDNKVPDDPNEQQKHVLYSLSKTVRQCITQTLYTPYIHVKDYRGKLLFNDKLTITEGEINAFAVNRIGSWDIHFIKTKNSLKVCYWAETNNNKEGDHNLYLDYINFSNGELNIEAYNKALDVITNMIRDKEQIKEGTPTCVSLLVHNYDPELKVWSFEHFQREFKAF